MAGAGDRDFKSEKVFGPIQVDTVADVLRLTSVAGIVTTYPRTAGRERRYHRRPHKRPRRRELQRCDRLHPLKAPRRQAWARLARSLT